MSTTATPRRRRPAGRSGRRHRSARGALLSLLLVAGLFALGVTQLAPPFDDAVDEITLPLRHDDVIRQQAELKDLDAALIAAVIYQETRFRPRTSPAGAEGLMQVMPDTARFIARRSGGTQFELRDLDTPQINIAYGSWYLRHLLERYAGDETLAIAAYNAGMTNVDRWVAAAGGPDAFDPAADIPFDETRAYVAGVLERRKEYRRTYPTELGL